MGFLIIVVIVVVIGLVFLAFSLRQKPKSTEAQEMQVEDLLQTMLVYTTDCYKNEMLSVRELIKECNARPSSQCENQNINFCRKLENTLEDVLEKMLGKEQKIREAFIHGYALEINASEYLKIEKGNLSGNYFSAFVPVPLTIQGEEAIIRLRVYY